MEIGVIGLGYVGLPTAIILAYTGNNVIGYDINKEKINNLKLGLMPFVENNLSDYFNKVYNSNLILTNNLENVVNNSNVIYISVPTPSGKNKQADLSYLFKVIENLSKFNNINSKIIVIKSTIPVGTCDNIEKKYSNMKIIFIPEFLQEGKAIENLLNPDRIIIGIDEENNKIKNIFKSIYINQNIIFMSRKSAELVKYASNGFLALKITYINQIADLCEKCNANVWDVAKGIGLDKRIGTLFLNASVGYGGSCFPKDTNAFAYFAKKYYSKMSIIEEVININNKRISYIPNKILKYIYKKNNKNILFLGLAFKGGTADLRESPSLKIIDKFYQKVKYNSNIQINIYDVYNALYPLKKEKINQIFDLKNALEDANIIIVLTRDEYWKQNILNKHLKKCNTIIDYSGLLNKNDFDEKITFYQVGVNNNNE